MTSPHLQMEKESSSFSEVQTPFFFPHSACQSVFVRAFKTFRRKNQTLRNQRMRPRTTAIGVGVCVCFVVELEIS